MKLKCLFKRPTFRSSVILIAAGTALAYQPANARNDGAWTLPYYTQSSNAGAALFTVINTSATSGSNAIAGAAAGAGSIGVFGRVTSSDATSYPIYGINGSMTAGSQNIGYLGGIYSGTAGVSFTPIPSPNPGGITSQGAFGSAVDSTAYGVYGQNTAGTGSTGSAVGVYGISTNTGFTGGVGVNGVSNSSTLGVGVYGISNSTTTGYGVYGQSSSTNTSGGAGGGIVGVSGGSAYAGIFFGPVTIANNNTQAGTLKVAGATTLSNLTVTGFLNVTGSVSASVKAFKIDHPLDPAHKYLVHSCIESSEMMNLYRGTAILNSDGKATVTMPAWFDALNTDFSYQLTCVGGYAPVFVSKEVEHNQFEVAGGNPGMKVCWQVTGTRQDAYAKAHPMKVEQDKAKNEQGKYLDPADYGKSKTAQIGYIAPITLLAPHLPKPQTASNPFPHQSRKSTP